MNKVYKTTVVILVILGQRLFELLFCQNSVVNYPKKMFSVIFYFLTSD